MRRFRTIYIYVIPISIALLCNIFYYSFAIYHYHTNQNSPLSFYVATFDFSIGFSKIIMFLEVIMVPLELLIFKRFGSFVFMVITFFSLSFICAIIYQIVAYPSIAYLHDKEAESLFVQFYVATPILIGIGILNLWLHFRKRNRIYKPL
jgi:hypothetical protein